MICSGEPKGFLYTTETCTEFELTLEWKFPKDADGNSGVLVYTQDEPRIWPTSMQVQLHQPKAGSVFPSGDAMSDQSSELERDLARPVGTWNEGKIISRGGRLSVEVNGKNAGEVSGAKPSSGSIALQSEGSVVHFRRIRLRKLPVADQGENANAVPRDDTDGACSSPVIPRRLAMECVTALLKYCTFLNKHRSLLAVPGRLPNMMKCTKKQISPAYH